MPGAPAPASPTRARASFTASSNALTLAKSPLDPVPKEERGVRAPVWVEPKLVAEVDFRGWTHGDRVRQASFQGVREDKPAKQVVRESQSHGGEQPSRAVKRSAPRARNAKAVVGGVTLSHPDRVYWEDAGVTKRDLAEYYTQDLEMDAPARGRPADRAVALPGRRRRAMLLPEARLLGIATEHLHLVPEKGDKIISIDDLAGLIALVQAGVLEIHMRGTTIDDRERADRLVFDLDPGPGTGWKDVVAAAREVRERLASVKLKSFVKTTGGKGLHVVVPIKPAPWDAAKEFCRTRRRQHGGGRARPLCRRPRPRANATTGFSSITCATAARRPPSRPTPPARGRARRCRRRSTGRSSAASRLPTNSPCVNLPARLKRLRKDPWAGIGKSKQALPRFK